MENQQTVISLCFSWTATAHQFLTLVALRFHYTIKVLFFTLVCALSPHTSHLFPLKSSFSLVRKLTRLLRINTTINHVFKWISPYVHMAIYLLRLCVYLNNTCIGRNLQQVIAFISGTNYKFPRGAPPNNFLTGTNTTDQHSRLPFIWPRGKRANCDSVIA